MLITDVMREANNDHAIYFLLTAYVESMRFGGEFSVVSDPITRLPLGGVPDIHRRFEMLVCDLDSASKNLDDKTCECVKEAMEVFATALTRLRSLRALSGRKPVALTVTAMPVAQVRPSLALRATGA